MKLVGTMLVIAAPWIAASCGASAQDSSKGKAIFGQCMACHQLDKNMVGPKLQGVVGRQAGSADFANYSPLMKAAGEAGLTWNETELVDYLKNPTDYLTKYDKDKGKAASGQSKMLFKLSNEQQRKDVVAYLASTK